MDLKTRGRRRGKILGRAPSAPSEKDPAGGYLHDEQQVEGDKPGLRPDLDGREVDRAEHVPVGLEEFLPGRLPLSLRHRLDAVFTENGADGGVRDLVPEVSQCALDAVVAPGRILPGHAQHEFDDLRSDPRAPDASATIAAVPLLGDELPVPTKDGIG
jgi:hypothetical protein